MFNKEKFLKDLEQLVSIDCGTYTPKGVARVADVLEARFKAMGFFTKQIIVSDKVGPLLVAYNKDNASNYDAVIIGHMDTVYAEGTVKNYPMKIEGNNVRGLGVIDMKSGILTSINAVEELSKQELDSLSLCFLCNPDEEISSVYSSPFMEEYVKKANNALIMEYAGKPDRLITKRKGIVRFNVEFTGKPAHGSVPQEGASAVNELAHFITRVQEFNNEKLGTTINVGEISGGVATNVVAEKANLEFEIRFFDMDVYNQMLSRIKEFVSTPIIKGVSMSLSEVSFKPAMNVGEKNKPLESLVLNAANKVGLFLKTMESAGGSDGNFTAFLGVPTMDGLGPVGNGWHNADVEILYIDSVQPRVQLLKEIMLLLSINK